jgi:hypothetical protein
MSFFTAVLPGGSALTHIATGVGAAVGASGTFLQALNPLADTGAKPVSVSDQAQGSLQELIELLRDKVRQLSRSIPGLADQSLLIEQSPLGHIFVSPGSESANALAVMLESDAEFQQLMHSWVSKSGTPSITIPAKSDNLDWL